MKLQEAMVYVVEDDLALQKAVASLLKSVGLKTKAFSSAAKFLEATLEDLPRCLLLDIRLPDLSGMELQRRLSAIEESLPIVFITGHGDIRMSVQAMRAGAVDFLTKPFEPQELIDAVQRALERSRSRITRTAELQETKRRYALLTKRELQLLPLLVAGGTNREFAQQIGTSENTIKVHRSHIMRKMGASSLPELIRFVDRLNSSNQALALEGSMAAQ